MWTQKPPTPQKNQPPHLKSTIKGITVLWPVQKTTLVILILSCQRLIWNISCFREVLGFTSVWTAMDEGLQSKPGSRKMQTWCRVVGSDWWTPTIHRVIIIFILIIIIIRIATNIILGKNIPFHFSLRDLQEKVIYSLAGLQFSI